MGHPKVDNSTPFAFEAAYASDEDGRPLVVPLVQATYKIVPSRTARPLVLAETQEPPNLAGQPWGEDVGTSGYKIEPAFAFTKLATDVVLVGHAQSPRGPVPELTVIFRVGPVGRVLRVVGDRRWAGSMGAAVATRPMPFERIPLSYQRAFGGWDRSDPNPEKHVFEPRNPVGIGFRAPKSKFQEGTPLPNIEDPNQPMTKYGHAIAPAGVGFISPDWQPRAAFAGTYDEAWTKTRMPLLPEDFDRRFFNAASPGLIAKGYLRGDEPVTVDGASPHGRLACTLPGAHPPTCRVTLVGKGDVEVKLALDTIVVDADRDLIMLLWRGFTALRDGPHDVWGFQVKEGSAR